MSDTIDAEVVEKETAIERLPETSIAQADELTIDQLVAQVQKVQQAMQKVMKNDEHYGTIPGTQKPTLLKPGAEKLMVLFRLGPKYVIEKTFHDDGHLTVIATANLHHIPTGNFVAAGEGMCSTKEAKYAYRKGTLACPDCGNAETFKRSKNKPEWYCWAKIGGCGATFPQDDERIKSQNPGRVANPDLADSYNTVLKMASKRALIAGVLNATAASDIFTQDIEDFSSQGSETQTSEPSAAGSATPHPGPDTAAAPEVVAAGDGGGEVAAPVANDPVAHIRAYVGTGEGQKKRREQVLAIANRVLLAEQQTSLIPTTGLTPTAVTALPTELVTKIAEQLSLEPEGW